MDRLYTPDLANRSLPLVRAIAEDVRSTAEEMERIWQELEATAPTDPRRAELADRVREIRRRFAGLLDEFDQLGVELKDPFQGLLDFRARRGSRDVYLCWRLGEDRVGHWHEIEAGFRGRQPIETLGAEAGAGTDGA